MIKFIYGSRVQLQPVSPAELTVCDVTKVIWELLLFHCRIWLDNVSVSAARVSITEHDVSWQQERRGIDSSTAEPGEQTVQNLFCNWPAGWGSLRWWSTSGQSSASPPDTLWSPSSASLCSPQNWSPEQINKPLITQNKYWSQELKSGAPVQVSHDGQIGASQRSHQLLFQNLLLLQEVQQVVTECLQSLVLLSWKTTKQT